jgi:hypothetical protein
VRCRENKLKKRRYTAVFQDVRGAERSAGTFADRAAAARAWKSAEASVADGRYLDVDQGRKRFEEYARDTWLPQYAGEDSTVQGYDFYLEKYLIPEFGATRMIEITPGRVRAFYALMRDAEHGRSTVEKCKTVLCSLFNTAVNDRVVGLHPCRGVITAPVVQAKLRILTPPEYARLNAHLRDDYARLMVDVLAARDRVSVGRVRGVAGRGPRRARVHGHGGSDRGGGEGEVHKDRGAGVHGEGVSEEQALAQRRDQPRAYGPADRALLGPRSASTDVPRPRSADGLPLAAWRRARAAGAGDVQGQRVQFHARHAVRVYEGVVPVRGVPGGGGRLPGGAAR